MNSPFDPGKDAINRAKHGISLAFGDMIFEDGRHVVTPTIRLEDGEKRFKAIGLVNDRLYTVVFVWRDNLRRFISVRKSNETERRSYRNPR